MAAGAESFEVDVGSQFLRYPEYLGAIIVGFVAFGIAAAFGWIRGTYAPVLFLVLAPIASLQLIGAKLRVGPDGLLVRWVGRTRFIDARRIVRIEIEGKSSGRALDISSSMETSIVVHRRDGSPVRIALTLGRLGGISTEEAKQLAERIEQVIAPIEARDVSARIGPRLARGSRDLGAWLGDMRALGARASATLRDADIDSEELWTLASGSSVDPDVRVGAAIALAGRGEEERARVRVAAVAIAEPKLRVAIEAAASGDDAAIARAVSRLRQ